MHDSKICLQCNTEFYRVRGRKGQGAMNWRNRKYCSHPCSIKHRTSGKPWASPSEVIKTYYNKHRAKRLHDAALRRAEKKRKTPAWANLKKIERIYQLSAWASKFTDEPLEVDHIIPLKGDLISGLHVEHNLQIISKSENRAKNNRWPL